MLTLCQATEATMQLTFCRTQPAVRELFSIPSWSDDICERSGSTTRQIISFTDSVIVTFATAIQALRRSKYRDELHSSAYNAICKPSVMPCMIERGSQVSWQRLLRDQQARRLSGHQTEEMTISH